ncbi:MAG: metal ABC transporter substrate-binding protein [Patescibacteria group bacterium]|jgi:zinc transport system substrate-binding protein
MHRWIGFVVGLLVVLGIAAVVLNLRTRPVADDRPLVVTTFYPITALAAPIAGTVARVEQLVPAGQEVHDYQAAPANLAALRSATLVISNGAELEHEWLDSLFTASDSLATRLELAAMLEADVKLLSADDEEAGEAGTDPHIWLSPKNAILLAGYIRDALVRVDEMNRETYESNAAALIAELSSLDQEFRASIATFRDREFIAFHSAFSYLARDYGLEQVATIEATPGEAPRPAELARIRSLVQEKRLRGLFTEPQYSPATVDQLARDLGIAVRELDPLETNELDESYVDGMRRNLEALRAVLG